MSLDSLLRPRSIAILGASEDFVKISGRPLKFLLDKGYSGRILPVNPKYERIAGLPCYPSIAAVPETVDMAIVAVPAGAVLEALEQCVAKGVRAAVVFSSGFGEMGGAGRDHERRLAALARRSGLRLCGPNTLGFMNNFERVMATFSQAGEGETPPGPVGFVTQSGAFGTAIFALARQRGLPLGYFINSGNEADVDFGDLLAYVLEDERIRVVAGYIEGLRDGRKVLRAAARALELGKPIVMVKVARSGAGARAAASHTGSLAGADRVYGDVFRQAGIIRAQNDEQLLDLVSAFVHCPLPHGPGVGIVTQSGGAGVLMADRCEELGLQVPELTEETCAALRKVVPAFGAVKNPVDITAQFIADPELLVRALDLVLADPRVDATVFYLGLMERAAAKIAADLAAIAKRSPKPLLVAWAGAPEAGLRALREAGVCVLPSATRAVDAIHGLVLFAEAKRRFVAQREGRLTAMHPASVVPASIEGPAAGEGRALGSDEAFRLLEAYGLRCARWRLVTTPEEAAQAAEELGGSLALKIESPDLPHKTDAGGVRLDVSGRASVLRAFDEILAVVRTRRPDARILGVLAQEMVPGGTEMVVGIHRDPHFGPLVMVGLGGVFVEVLEDVAFRAAPLTRGDALDMVRSLRGARILRGIRGRPPADLDALVDALLALSRLATDSGQAIAELDVNPLIVHAEGQGVTAVDALVVRQGQ
ncbi:MAG TPA: acetate--CoA ligase family protein [Methylomirabilota bacterium]|nr:acetate--CoA ligase family protein [Methylomirabilota bacterium]